MITTARANAILTTEYPDGDLLSLHSAFSLTGTNEITGGSYAKQACTYSAAASRSRAIAATESFTGLPASTTVAWIGTWDSAGTTFKGMSPNGGTERSFQVDLTNNRVYCEGHGMVDNDRVTFQGGTLPTNITEGAHLYVITTTAGDPDYFQVSLTSGGAAIDMTTSQPSADATVSKIVLEVYTAAGGTHNVTALSHSL